MKKERQKIVFLIFPVLLVFCMPALLAAQKNSDVSEYHEKPIEGFLYFTDAERTGLKSAKRSFSAALEGHALGLEIISMLMAGPTRPDLRAVWPEGTKANAFFIADDGTAYVDLSLGKGMETKTDTITEILAVYSLVNSLALNIPEIKQVKILLDGDEALSLAGHIGLEYPFKTNMLIVK